jgi:hypothetical protein
LKLNTLAVGLSPVEGDILSSLPCLESGGDISGTTLLVPSVDGTVASWMINAETVSGELKCETHSSSSVMAWPIGGDIDAGGTGGGLVEGEALSTR